MCPPASELLNRSALTAKQLKVLVFIEQEILRSGRPPTLRSIAKEFDLKAVGTVQDYISKLVELGFLEKEPGQYRGIRLPFQTQVTWVPILGSVPAGKPIEAIHDSIGSIALSGVWKGDLFALKVKGESMRDRGILEGDVVIVRQQPDAESGEIVVALLETEATVKILERKKGKIRLLPANPSFQPIELSGDRDCRIAGRVIGVQRRLD